MPLIAAQTNAAIQRPVSDGARITNKAANAVIGSMKSPSRNNKNEA